MVGVLISFDKMWQVGGLWGDGHILSKIALALLWLPYWLSMGKTNFETTSGVP